MRRFPVPAGATQRAITSDTDRRSIGVGQFGRIDKRQPETQAAHARIRKYPILVIRLNGGGSPH